MKSESTVRVNIPEVVKQESLPPIVYGLEGIMELFKVSKTTAWRLRHGIIEDACSQQGNKILVNTRKALELFGVDVTGLINEK